MPKPTSLDRDSPHRDRTAPRNVVLTRHPAPPSLFRRFSSKWLGRILPAISAFPAPKGSIAGTQPASMIAHHDRACSIPRPANRRRSDLLDAFKSQAERRAELRWMRTIATTLLVLMAAIYVAMRRAPAAWVWAPYLSAFAEAGMVGACADWFAVVALFRRPLGLPIPHTAVVPENKRRIGAAMGRFITNNFLSPRVAIARLASVDFVGLAARWLEDERNARAVATAAGRAIPYALDLVPKAADRRMGGSCRAARDRGGPGRAARLPGPIDPMGAGSGPDAARPGPRFRRDDARPATRRRSSRHVSQKTWRWIPKWVDDMIAAKVVNGLAGTLKGNARPRPSVARAGQSRWSKN